MSIKAALSFKQDNAKNVGADRIALLEAVGQHGSISAAARAVGLTYKAAWDALETMQNLVSQPLLEKSAGGRHGGGAKLTPAATRLIETFHRLDAGLASMLNDAADDFATIGISPSSLMQGFMMRTSARNMFAGTIEEIHMQPPAAFIFMRLAQGLFLTAQITVTSVKNLGLVEGRSVAALIKAPFVKILPKEAAESTPHNNHLAAIIRHIEKGPETTEIIAEIGADRRVVSILPSAENQGYAEGQAVTIEINPNDILIATT